MPSEDAKPVKKEEVEGDDDDEKPISHVRGRNKTKPKVKKEEEEEEPTDYDSPIKRKPIKPIKPTKPIKVEAKSVTKDDKKKMKKKKKEEGKGKDEGKKRERKVYDLPGQKRDPPEQRDPLRIFYETLNQQKPTSELAANWMMESGLLPLEAARKVYEKKMKSKNQKLTSPAKPIKTVKETAKSMTVKKKAEATPNSSARKKIQQSSSISKQSKKKRKAESSEEKTSSDEDSGDEFVVSPKKVKPN